MYDYTLVNSGKFITYGYYLHFIHKNNYNINDFFTYIHLG